MLPMEPTPSGEGWQLVALDLGVDNEAVNEEVPDILHSKDLGGDVRRCPIWRSMRLYQDERKTKVKSWV